MGRLCNHPHRVCELVVGLPQRLGLDQVGKGAIVGWRDVLAPAVNGGNDVLLWPFDGWGVPPNLSVVAEVYPALWSRTFPSAGRTPGQQDAFATAEWLRRTDMEGGLERFLHPEFEPNARKLAEIEGWILGVL